MFNAKLHVHNITEEIENWNEVEEVLMDDVIDTSVFFTYQHPELESIFEEVSNMLLVVSNYLVAIK